MRYSGVLFLRSREETFASRQTAKVLPHISRPDPTKAPTTGAARFRPDPFCESRNPSPPPNPPEPMVPNTLQFIVSDRFLNRMSETKTSTCPSTFLPLVILCEACSSTALSYRGCSPELPLTSMGVERGVSWRCFPATARGDFRFQANGKRVSTHFAPGPNEGPDDGNGALPSGSFLRKQKS